MQSQSSRWLTLISYNNALRITTFSIIAAGLCSPLMVKAAKPVDGERPSTSWSLGLGGVSKQQPYTDIDRDNMAIPLLKFENKYLRIFGPEVGFKLPGVNIGNSQKLDFSIIAKYDGSGYESGDAEILSDMSERKSGILAGAKMEWNNPFADVTFEWLGDASGNSKGQRVNLTLEKTWRIGESLMLTPRAGVAWQDKKYIAYYYGVRDSEARVGRAAYTGKSGANAELGVRGIYMFDNRHSAFMDIEVSSLAKGIKDSPLVDSSTENRIFLGYLYRFQ